MTCVPCYRISATGGTYRRVFRHGQGSGGAGYRGNDAAEGLGGPGAESSDEEPVTTSQRVSINIHTS